MRVGTDAQPRAIAGNVSFFRTLPGDVRATSCLFYFARVILHLYLFRVCFGFVLLFFVLFAYVLRSSVCDIILVCIFTLNLTDMCNSSTLNEVYSASSTLNEQYLHSLTTAACH